MLPEEAAAPQIFDSDKDQQDHKPQNRIRGPSISGIADVFLIIHANVA